MEGRTANIQTGSVPAGSSHREGARSRGLSLSEDADLFLLLGLLLLTEVFGRSFSQIGVGDTVFVTEVLLVATTVAIVVRLGLRDAFELLRARVPLVLLLIFWLLGAYATVRGLRDWGLSFVTEDVGLFEYSVLVPLTVLVVRDRARLETFGLGLLIGSVVCAVLFFGTMIVLRVDSDSPLVFLVGAPSGMYISFFVGWVATRFAHGLGVRPAFVALAAFGLLMMWITDQRSVWVAVIAVLVTVVLLSPPRLIPIAVMASLVVVTFAATVGLQSLFPVPPGATVAEGDGGAGNPQAIREVSAIAGGASGAEAENVQWRLAYWKELSRRTFSDPQIAAVGIGFGEPAAFVWNGRKYDFRDGDPGTGQDVAGPHNSFVAILYRMGLPALLCVVGLVGVALWRVRPLLWGERRLESTQRANVVAIVAALGSTVAVASFNEALKGPFLGMYFWVAVALLLAVAAIYGTRESAGSDRPA